jgi:hypothetical protein
MPTLTSTALNATSRLKPLQALERLTPQQREQVMYWVGGLAPLATNVTTPLFTRLRFDKTGLSQEEKQKNVTQELARQLVSAATHIITYFGSSALVGVGSKAAHKNLLMFLAGTFASFIGYAVIRPLISAELILRWLYPNEASPSQASQKSTKLTTDVKTPELKTPDPADHFVFGGFIH